MGIVNAGPDSFSDAVRLGTLEAQLAHARRLGADGADLIDVGGESGVTYTKASASDVEIARVVPLVERLAAEGVAVSVDTWKPAVAAAALDAGAAMINDTSGLADLEIAALCARTGAALVVMHTRAAPKQERFADYGGDVVSDVVAFLRERCAAARRDGRRAARDRPAACARPPAAARRLAQVLPGRDHGPPARRAPGGDAGRHGVGGRCGCGDRPRARRGRGRRLPARAPRAGRRRGGAGVRHGGRGPQVDPGRPVASPA